MIVTKNRTPDLSMTNGTTLSVQASKYHHCEPHTDEGPYTHVSVSSSTPCPAFDSRPRVHTTIHDHDTGVARAYIYYTVPITDLETEIAARGGLADGRTLTEAWNNREHHIAHITTH